ncbi:MAG: rRNA maturation RNase YbeY [Legionella sp.]|nr:MAG: rRNA maturation RNase YbeY [Legionella sp.]
MNYLIDIQNATDVPLPLNEQELSDLAILALRDNIDKAELTIRLVNQDEMIHLNNSYRQLNKTTNVLAFPAMIPEAVELEYPLLGDVIICPEVLAHESEALKKGLKEHWSLIVIHGVLHLLGYDHIKDDDAVKMQAVEIKLLNELGFSNPYEIEESNFE